MSAKRPPTPTSGALVLDFQGPFEPKCELITGSCEPFVALRLFANPDVAIYISSDTGAPTRQDDEAGRAMRFRVNGLPAPQGSKRHVGGGRMVES